MRLRKVELLEFCKGPTTFTLRLVVIAEKKAALYELSYSFSDLEYHSSTIETTGTSLGTGAKTRSGKLLQGC